MGRIPAPLLQLLTQSQRRTTAIPLRPTPRCSAQPCSLGAFSGVPEPTAQPSEGSFRPCSIPSCVVALAYPASALPLPCRSFQSDMPSGAAGVERGEILKALQLQLLLRPSPASAASAPAPGLSQWGRVRRGLSSGPTQIFDEELKALQRERILLQRQPPSGHEGASSEGLAPPLPLPLTHDPLLEHIAENLLDRLQDCKREFASVLVLGGAVGPVLRLLQQQGGIEHLTVVDSSPALLAATKEALEAETQGASTGGAAGTGAQGTAGEQAEGALPSSIQFVASTPGELLPVEPQSFDLVLACLGLHWHNDLPTLLLQCRLALKPDGLFLGAMFGGETLQEMRIACTLAEMERRGGVSPRVSPLAQVRDGGNLLTGAGLSLTTVDVDSLTVQYPSAVEVVEHLRSMGETSALRARDPILTRDSALAAAALYQHMFRSSSSSSQGSWEDSIEAGPEGEDGRDSDPGLREPSGAESPAVSPSAGGEESTRGVTATYQVIFLSGWAPHTSQQQAKARGSATVSFDDLQRLAQTKKPPPA